MTHLTSNVSFQNHCRPNNISNRLTYMKITVMTDIEENIEDLKNFWFNILEWADPKAHPHPQWLS
jgi:hypothetical protein